MKNKLIIGKKDIADFPELELFNIDVKVDTGAYTSSIHCHHIEELEVDGEAYVSFEFLDSVHENYNNKKFVKKIHKEKIVKNSFGLSEKRYIIETNITLFEKTFPIQLSLSDRSEMKFPVLLGRRLLNQTFIVDSSKSNLSFKQKTINKKLR